ncbi:hypothetical protein WJX73_009492 [Symbiochloris irregularis]|uniref:BZIP domain-containing protein n=1 Tax=Symbiochloris irregularis TaxID=706552 RepID=A0AAW1NZV0_9CHLO
MRSSSSRSTPAPEGAMKKRARTSKCSSSSQAEAGPSHGDAPASGEQPSADEHSAVLFFKHPTTVRMRNREAQARWRNRQKGKQAEEKMKMAEVEEARKQLQAETMAFNAQRQAWQAFMRSCQQQHQGHPGRSGLQPDYSVVPIRGIDTYQSAVLRTPMLPREVLDVQFAINETVHRVCGWPQLPRDAVINFRLDSLFRRKKLHTRALSKLLSLCEDKENVTAATDLCNLMHGFLNLARMLGWTALSNGTTAAGVIDSEYTQAGLRECGVPSVGHWQRVAASLDLTKQQHETILQMREEWYLCKKQARQQAASVPSTVQAYLSEQPGQEPRVSHGQLEDCHVRLQRCRQEEHKAACKFNFGVRGQVLTPIQNAKVLLLSWPYKADMEAILNGLPSEHAPPMGHQDHDPALLWPLDSNTPGHGFGLPDPQAGSIFPPLDLRATAMATAPLLDRAGGTDGQSQSRHSPSYFGPTLVQASALNLSTHEDDMPIDFPTSAAALSLPLAAVTSLSMANSDTQRPAACVSAAMPPLDEKPVYDFTRGLQLPTSLLGAADIGPATSAPLFQPGTGRGMATGNPAAFAQQAWQQAFATMAGSAMVSAMAGDPGGARNLDLALDLNDWGALDDLNDQLLEFSRDRRQEL